MRESRIKLQQVWKGVKVKAFLLTSVKQIVNVYALTCGIARTYLLAMKEKFENSEYN
jgi:hypothetical protein